MKRGRNTLPGKYSMSQSESPSPFIYNQPLLTIWEVGLRWAGYEVKKEYEKNLPQAAKDAMRLIMEAQGDGELQIIEDLDYIPIRNAFEECEVDEWGDPIFSAMRPRFGGEQEAIIHFQSQMIRNCTYEAWHLQIVYVDKEDLAKWAMNEGLPFPDFWFSESEKRKVIDEFNSRYPEKAVPIAESDVSEGRLKQDEIDAFWQRLSHKQRARLMTREAAKVIWGANPDFTITQVANHEVVQEYCGAKVYAGKDTVRDWLKGLDPRPRDRRVGRPPKK